MPSIFSACQLDVHIESRFAQTFLKGAATGAVLGGITGLTFGAGTTATVAALSARGAATGVAASAAGNVAGQFHGNQGRVNLTEVAVSGALGAFPGAAQGALKGVALKSGLGQSPANTVGSMGLVAKIKFATEAAGLGISAALPDNNWDLSWAGEYINSLKSKGLDSMRDSFGVSFGKSESRSLSASSGN